MLPPGDLNKLIEQLMAQLIQGKNLPVQDTSVKSSKTSCCRNGPQKQTSTLTPQKVLVILGLLGGVLEVKSILIDRDQVVQILLSGSLRRKTRLEKMLDEIGDMPFDEVMKAVLGRVK